MELNSLLKDMGLTDTFSASLSQVEPPGGENSCSTTCTGGCSDSCQPGCSGGCSGGRHG